MTTRVAVLAAAALWVGCLWDGPVIGAVVSLVLLTCAAVTAWRWPAWVAPLVVLVALGLLGSGLAGARSQLREASPLVALGNAGVTRTVAGRVVTEPRATPFGVWAIVRVSRIDGVALGSRAVLTVDDGDGLAAGTAVDGRMQVSALPDGGFGTHLRDLGAVAALRPDGPWRTRPAPMLVRHTTVVRARAREAFDRALTRTHAALLGAVVLGTRDGVPHDALRAAGLSHLVVVSGRHVAVLLGGVLAVSAATGVGHRGRHRCALVMLWWFVLLTRWQPSVLRAAAMASLALVAALRGRARATTHALAVTVIMLLLVDPMLARRVGFALSVLATGGVLVVVDSDGGADGVRGVRSGLRTAVRTTVAAQIATAPVILTIAGTVPLAAVPANVVAGPAATLAQGIGVVAAALALVHVPLAAAVARLSGAPLALLVWASTAFTAAPPLSPRGAMIVAAGGLAWLGLRRRLSSWRPVRRLVWVTAGAASVAVVVASHLPPRAPPSLRLVAVDVGQGDGLLVEAPDGRDGARMVIDAGAESAALADALRARRIRHLDVVVVSHGDHDHAGGVADLLAAHRVGTLVVAAGDPTLRGDGSARDALRAAADAGIPVTPVAAGQRFTLGSSAVEVLAPTAAAQPGEEPNSRSIVLRVTGAHGSMLLTGDADEISQHRLLARDHDLRADVLKVPHHGGATNAPGFLDAVHADVAVVSVGADNTYGHPHPDTLADLAPLPVYRTDRDGTVTVTLAPDGPVVTTDRAP